MSRRRKILMFTLTILVLAVLLSVVRHFQLRRSLEAYISKLKGEGEPLSLAQVIPPPVPLAANGAPLITNALAQIYSVTNSMIDYNPPYAMNQTIPGTEMAGWRQPLIHSPDSWPRHLTNTWQELGAQLSRHRGDLNDFRQLIERPTLDFDVDYSSAGGWGLMSHLPQIKVAAQWLMAWEFYDLHQNKTADACTDVRAMLALVKGETDERFEISQLVRFAVAQITADATWNILQATNVTDYDLVQLQQDWQSLRFIAPMKKSFLFERVNQVRLLNSLRQSPTNFLQTFASIYIARGYRVKQVGEGIATHWLMVDKSSFPKRVINDISVSWDKALWCWFWSYADEARALRMWQPIIEGTQMLETNRSFPSVQSFVKADSAWRGLDSVKRDPFAVFTWNTSYQLVALDKLATVEAVRNIVITAIALKRYELRHQHPPASLAKLVPDFLKSVPIDYRDGKPLHYRRDENGTVLLYSVGKNGKNDGGNPHLNKDSQDTNYDWMFVDALDWVWPQLATPAEIQAYYAHHKASD